MAARLFASSRDDPSESSDGSHERKRSTTSFSGGRGRFHSTLASRTGQAAQRFGPRSTPRRQSSIAHRCAKRIHVFQKGIFPFIHKMPNKSANPTNKILEGRKKMKRNASQLVGILFAVVAANLLPLADAGADSPRRDQAITPADWPMYNHDQAGWRFNPAEKTLSPANAGKLVKKWRFPAADSKETIGVVHATPTVVAGEVYFGTANKPAFYKLTADGKQCWVYRPPVRKADLPSTDGPPVD